MNAPRINSNPSFERAISDHSRVDRDSQLRRGRLSSGLRVNGGRDDSAFLSVSEGMRAQLGGLTEGTRNTEKALDLLRTAEGAMNEISAILLRMRELATQATTDTLNDRNREATDAEFGQLKEYIDRVAKLASYNEQSLLSGFGNEVDAAASTLLDPAADTGVRRVKLSSATAGTYAFADAAGDNRITLGNGVTTQTVSLGAVTDGDEVAAGTTLSVNFDILGVELFLAGEGVGKALGSYRDGDLDGRSLVVVEGTGGSFQLGSDAVAADRIEYDIRDMTIGAAVLDIQGLSVNTRDGARSALARLDAAIDRVSRERGSLGAVMNRLEHTLSFTEGSIEGVAASESTIRDADLAWETTALAKNQVLQSLTQSAMVQSRVPVEIVMSLIA